MRDWVFSLPLHLSPPPLYTIGGAWRHAPVPHHALRLNIFLPFLSFPFRGKMVENISFCCVFFLSYFRFFLFQLTNTTSGNIVVSPSSLSLSPLPRRRLFFFTYLPVAGCCSSDCYQVEVVVALSLPFDWLRLSHSPSSLSTTTTTRLVAIVIEWIVEQVAGPASGLCSTLRSTTRCWIFFKVSSSSLEMSDFFLPNKVGTALLIMTWPFLLLLRRERKLASIHSSKFN